MAIERASSLDVQLHEMVLSFANDPLGFVQWCYPWGRKGPLEPYDGPDTWQRETLQEIGAQTKARAFDGVHPVLPIRIGISSGHGIGKSSLSAWIVDWIMSTRPDAKGTITANTNDQLEQKTWAAVRYWTRLCLTGRWFEVNSERMYHKAVRDSWFCTPQSCAEENSEAFAGQHAANSTSFYIFDEASAVPDKIHEVAEGGLTDGEPMIFQFGNPTRNTGAFHRAMFGSARERWHGRIIDSRDCALANKAIIAEWLEDYGEDSDFFRVRVRGLPPNASELQYIDAGRIFQAQTNNAYVLQSEPLIAGVDVSGGGSAWTVCMFRQGFDARRLKPLVFSGEQTMAHERQLVVSALANALNEHAITAMFIDSAFGAPIVVRLRQMGFTNVHEVNFGGPSADLHAENARAAMWKAVKEWLPKGAIDQHDHRLASDLAGPGYHLNRKNKLVLESKASMVTRGIASPDRADALALTFAMPVRMPSAFKSSRMPQLPSGPGSWMAS